MTIYELLEKYQKRRNAFQKSEEFRFFLDNRELLNKISKFSFLYDSDVDDFEIMRANCLLYGFLNKASIEQEIINVQKHLSKDEKVNSPVFMKALHERLVELPYYDSGSEKIYIPFFTRAINLIYTQSPERLLSAPYNELIKNYTNAIVDPFDTYGADIYNSYFTHLIKVSEKHGEIAFFHYDTQTIYIVNNQGRLDDKIVLFDRYLKQFTDHHMLERIKPVVEAYFSYNREEFIKNLFNNGFISSKMLSIIKKNSHR